MDDTRWSRIVSIKYHSTGEFWDLTVPDGEHYYAEGFVNHNSGKTRAGSEWTHRYARANPGCYIGLIAPTTSDARDVIVEGESGILATSHPAFRPEWEPSKRRLTWPNGSTATTFSDDTPERLRGPQHGAIWFDELAAYKNLDTTWSNALFGLRLGQHPKLLITTTPKPLRFLRELVKDPQMIVSTASTYDNIANLAVTFRQTVIKRYEGTALGEQELNAIILEDDFGEAMWIPSDIQRLDIPIQQSELGWHVIAVDPGVTTGGDATGIVVMAATSEREPQRRRGVVLADQTMVKASPEQWAQRIVSTYHALPQPCVVIAESNQGGELVSTVIHQIDPTVPVSLVHSHKSKQVRAEPVVMAYRMGRVVHMDKNLGDLEAEMTSWIPGISPESPNRIDALVHGLTALLVKSDSLRSYGSIRRASTSERGLHSVEAIKPRSSALADLQARRESRWSPRRKPPQQAAQG